MHQHSFGAGHPPRRSLEERRQLYAEELAALGGLRSPSLLRALSTVRREDFLPPGPWIIELADGSPFVSDDANPAHILHGVGVVLDTQRALHCANPARVARILQSAEFQRGETVLHVGAGLGYYTAIMAELVGPGGREIAAEIDPDLRRQATNNLAPWPNVEVVGDALELELPPLDVVYASCGMASLPRPMLEASRPNGRMLVPLTGRMDAGYLFAFRRRSEKHRFAAEALGIVRFYPCIGLRGADQETRINTAMQDGRGSAVKSLRIDPHPQDDACWLHNPDWCLSCADPD